MHVENYFSNFCSQQYYLRSKGKPYWVQTVMGGINKKTKDHFLSYTDIYGTQFKNRNYVITGLGLHYCQVLFENHWRPDLSEQEARKLMEDCLKIMFLRDKKAGDSVQFGLITADGVKIEEPYQLQGAQHDLKYVNDRPNEWYLGRRAIV
uniref:Proteasome subunit beta type-4 n=1 Tax=Strombidium inclinatum TaxID=197538 RepID=A0A7S3MX26_9SPIT|mmetsp:Transcript_24706/g.38460  ORF Transcript_24706/g.38460 Transcript_24706/m.38460 type:complete len:150 (+) Transcript_24706:272-721(+)